VASALEPAYLICGSDRSKVLRAVSRLRSRVEAQDGVVDLFDAALSDGATVAAASQQLGLFSAARLVIVTGVESWRADDVAALAVVVGDPPVSTTICLVAGPGLRKDHRVRTLVTGPKRLLVFDVPTGRDLPRYVAREANRLGARIDPATVRRLIEIVGEHPVALEQELDKLATYAAGEPIDELTVELLAFPSDDTSPFALTDAVAARNRTAAMRALVRAEQAGTKPHALIPQLARHVALLGQAHAALRRGDDAKAFARAAQIHEFRARKLLDAAGGWSPRETARMLVRLAVADYRVKGGARIEPTLELERAVRDAL
jgi:DNA polymerase III subunit delta